jgi:hypothetical protein
MAGAADFEREADPQQQIRQFLGVIRRGWLAILTSLGAGLLLGLGLYFFIPKSYVSSAKLELTSNWMFDSLAQARDMDTLPYSLRKRNLEDQLRSTTYVEPVLDQCEWDDWSRAKAQGAQARMVFLRKVKEKIDTRVVRGELGETLVFVNFSWHDKDRAREFCEKLTRWWIDSGVRNHVADVSSELAMGEQILAERKRELDQASRRLEEFQVRHGISDIDQRQGATIQLDGLLQSEAVLATQVADIEARIDALDRKLLAEGPDGELSLPPTLPASSPLVDSQRASALAALEQTIRQIEQLKAKGATDKWRPLKQLIDSLESQLIALASRAPGPLDEGPKVPNPEWRIVFDQREALMLELEGLRASGATLDLRIADQRRLLETLPQVLREHIDLQAEVTIRRQLHTEQETRLALVRDKKFAADRRGPGAQQPVIELEKPLPATAPSAFLGMIALAVSTLLGVGGALVAVVGRELFRASFRSADQARRTLKLPVLGEVAPIQTVPELRRARFVRAIQIAASAVLLVGLGAVLWVCVEHPGELPRSVVEWALDLRASLA